MNLTGKIAVVTGASQGLGYAIAHRFVQEGASVLLCARTADGLEGAAERVRAAAATGTQVLAEPADVSSEADVNRLAKIIERQFGKLDILVSNAAVLGPKGAIDEVPWQAWSQTISVNLLGTALCCISTLASAGDARKDPASFRGRRHQTHAVSERLCRL